MEAGEAECARDAHAAHFVDVAAQHAPLSLPLDYVLMHRELGNFRASLQHAHSAGSPLFAPLAAWLMPFWSEVKLGEGRSWMEAALATEPEDLYVRFRLAWGLGILAGLQGDLGAAREYDCKALAICEQRSDKVEAPRVLSNLAGIEGTAGESEASLGYAERAERLARETGDA